MSEQSDDRVVRCSWFRGERLPQNSSKKLMRIPGVFYGGGCSYMACRGLLMGPIHDVLLITHGPVGCGFFSGINGRDGKAGENRSSFAGRCFSTDLREKDIVFGGEDKLYEAIYEAAKRFAPAAIAVCATCPVGLIGDDVEAVTRRAESELEIPVLALRCEGFRDEPGWLTGGREVVSSWSGRSFGKVGDFPIHYMSESYWGDNQVVMERLFRLLGYDVVCSLMGSTTFERIQRCHEARLVVLDSNKAIDAVPELLSKKYGCGWMRATFTGLAETIHSLRGMAAFFDDNTHSVRTEKVIESELERIKPEFDRYKERFSGLRAALFEDIFRSDAYAALLSDLQVEVILISQDYSAKEVKDDSFSLHVSLALCRVLDLASVGLAPESDDGCRAFFLLTRDEVRSFLDLASPDVCFAGIEEEFGHKASRIRSEQFTSEERGVQYAGFDGLIRFASDLAMAECMSHWQIEPPIWETHRS